MNTRNKPKWLRSVESLLSIRSQFLLSGNIRDRVWLDNADTDLIEALWLTLEPLGYECILLWDIVDHRIEI